MPRTTKPPRVLVIERLSDGAVVQGEPLVDDFTGEVIPKAQPRPKGEQQNTHEIDSTRPSVAEVATALVEDLVATGKRMALQEKQRKGKAPFPRRDFSPQASAERFMIHHKQGQGPKHRSKR